MPDAVHAEHASLDDWLVTNLSERDLLHLGIVSLNQWPLMTAIVGEVALAAHAVGSQLTVGMWPDRTPLPDPGWTTGRAWAHLTLSRTIDENLVRALRAAGVPSDSFAEPPIRGWHPRQIPVIPPTISRSDIRATTYEGSPMGRSILQVHPDGNTPIGEEYPWSGAYVHKAMESYAWVYDQVRALIRQRGITTLVVYNGRFTHDQAAAAAATAEGARVLYYDSGGLDTGFDLTPASTHDWVDLQRRMLALWDSWPRNDRDHIARSWFEGRMSHSEPGVRVFVEFQEPGNLDGVPDAPVTIAFFSSSPDEIAELDLPWEEFFGSQPEALSVLATAVQAIPGAQLVVRTHPHMRLKPGPDLDDWRAAVAAANPAAHFDADAPLDSYALMRRADVVVTYGSTSGIEAAYLGRPVVVLGPAAYDLLGCTTRARTPDEVLAAVREPRSFPSERALPYGLLMQRRGFTFQRVMRSPDGAFRIGDIALQDAHPLARKLSDATRARLIRRLTLKSQRPRRDA